MAIFTHFKNDWSGLRERTSSSIDELGKSFPALTLSNHAFLLVSLPESMNNIDDLQTKAKPTTYHTVGLEPSVS